MSRQETLSAPEDDLDAPGGPDVSVVVTLFEEGATLDELHRRLTATLEEENLVRLQDRFCDLDITGIDEAQPRTRVRICGEVQAIQVVPRAGSPWLEVTVGDGKAKAVAVFTGRKRIRGIDPGRGIVFEGMAGSVDGRLQLLNPGYTLLD